jgi:hypothetical protein
MERLFQRSPTALLLPMGADIDRENCATAATTAKRTQVNFMMGTHVIEGSTVEAQDGRSNWIRTDLKSSLEVCKERADDWITFHEKRPVFILSNLKLIFSYLLLCQEYLHCAEWKLQMNSDRTRWHEDGMLFLAVIISSSIPDWCTIHCIE